MTRALRLPLYATLMLSLALPLGANAQEQGEGASRLKGSSRRRVGLGPRPGTLRRCLRNR